MPRLPKIRNNYEPLFAEESREVLILLAHPDDEQYIAGSIQRMVTNGHNIHFMYTTSGSQGSDVTDPGITPTELGAKRQLEATAAVTSLGVPSDNIYFLQEDANELNYDIVKAAAIARLAAEGVSPDFIITFDARGGYGHQGHQIVQVIAIGMQQDLDSVLNTFFFAVPTSDKIINVPANTHPDISDNGGGQNTADDSIVDFYYPLTSAELAVKKALIPLHVSQYTAQFALELQNHYDFKPFEYFSIGAQQLGARHFSGFDYLSDLFK